MSKAILDALGVDDEVSALRSIAEFTQFLNGVLEATGKSKSGEALVAVRQSAALSRNVAELTGEQPAGSIGILTAWKSAFDQHPELEARIGELESQVDSRDRAELISRGQAERKLSPATASYWAECDEHGKPKRSLSDLRAFLASAPPIVPVPERQPKGQGDGLAGGKSYDDLTPMEKHQLLEQMGAEAFQAFRAESRRRVNP